MSKDNMSFLPEDYVERRIEQRTNFICLSLFAIVLAGIVVAWFTTEKQRAEIKAQSAEVDQAFAEAAKRLEQLDELQNRREQMLRQAQVASTLLEPVPRTFLMADLVNRMPPTLSLFEFTLESELMRANVTRRVGGGRSALAAQTAADKEKAEEESVPRYEVSLGMVGVAPTDVQVAQYMAMLQRSELVRNVNLVFSERTTIEETDMRRFRIEMTLNPSADVRRMDPLRLDRRPGRDPLEMPSITHEELLEQAEEAEDSPFADGLDATRHLDSREDR